MKYREMCLTLHGELSDRIQCMHRSLGISLLVNWSIPGPKPILFVYISKRTYEVIIMSIGPRDWKSDM